jgi:hypothetical protein
MEALITLAALGVGYAIGVLQQGIHIYTSPKAKEKKVKEPEYNEVSKMSPEVEHYFNETDGYIK